MVTTDTETSTAGSTSPLYQNAGVIRGDGASSANSTPPNTQISLHQGLDTTKIPSSMSLDSDLVENQYIIEIDDRLGRISTPIGAPATSMASPNFIDDDRIASYYLSKTSNSTYIKQLPAATSNDGTTGAISAVAGPRGTSLKFTIRASLELNTSTNLFSRLGSQFTVAPGGAGIGTFYYIDSTVRVTGVSTGYRIDIPVRFIKFKTL